MELFASLGFAGTTIKDIAQKAGVTEGALYRHYKSKEEMAIALFDRELSIIKEFLTASAAGEKAPALRLRDIIEYLYSSYLEKPWPLLFVILNFQNLQGESRLDNKKHIYDDITDYIRDLFQDQPGIRDYEFLATMITGLIVQPIIFHHYQRLSKHPVEYIEEISKSCEALAAQKTDRRK